MEAHEGPTPARLGLAMAMAFQLLNSVEERVSESLRELREEADSPETEKGLWFDQLSGLVKAGASADSIRILICAPPSTTASVV